MLPSEVLRNLREKAGLTQEKLAQQLHVTRQAVSRWETGETTPDTELLKSLSRVYNVTINTLLGSPVTLVCQCCGMPLEEDRNVSREPDGSFNEKYCQWCYAEGAFVYKTKEELIDFLTEHMSSDTFPPEQARAYFSEQIPKLAHWRGDVPAL